MAITYFGYQAGASITTLSAALGRTVAGYVCPGSGAQTVKELAVELDTGSAGNLLLGIYTTGGDLVVEGTAEKDSAIPAGWLTWTDAELTWHIGTTLTGGTTYVLAIASEGTFYKGLQTTGLANGTWHYNFGDYSNGLPDPEPAGNDFTIEMNIRCGVEPAAGVVNRIPIIDHYNRMMAMMGD